MTPTLAALVLTNLVYVVGAVAVASVVSGLYVLRHRKPKSLESGIESFSRELRALAPERRADTAGHDTARSSQNGQPGAQAARPTARGHGGRRQAGGAVATTTGHAPGPEVAGPPPAPAGDAEGPDPGSRSG